MKVAIAVLGEDDSDVDAVKVIIRRVLGRSVRVKTKSADGCARIPKKGRRWLQDFRRKGFTHAIVIRDLDRCGVTGSLNDRDALLSKLKRIECPSGMQMHICIPVEELEAWFWSCESALNVVLSGADARSRARPERIRGPKEELIRRSRDAGGRARYSTNMAATMAAALDLDRCADRCASFHDLREFLLRVKPSH